MKVNSIQATSTLDSFCVALENAKCKNYSPVKKLIKTTVAKEMYPEMVNSYKTVILPVNIVIRGVQEMYEELLDIDSIHWSTTGNYFRPFNEKILQLENLKSITIDGGEDIGGETKSIVAFLVLKAVWNEGSSKPLVSRCIISQQFLCRNFLDINEVLKQIILVTLLRVNFLSIFQLKLSALEKKLMTHISDVIMNEFKFFQNPSNTQTATRDPELQMEIIVQNAVL